MHKLIGLTGGIASGKTTVSDYIKEQGYPVLDADVYARRVTKKGHRGYHQIIGTFGEVILNGDGEINRQKLGEIIFNDDDKRTELNNIVHPEIRRMMNADEAEYLKESHVFLDIPLLFENGLDKKCDITVTVYIDRKTQLARLMERNDLSEQDASSRINSQMPLSEKRNLATNVFDNSGSIDELYGQIDGFLKRLESGE